MSYVKVELKHMQILMKVLVYRSIVDQDDNKDS